MHPPRHKVKKLSSGLNLHRQHPAAYPARLTLTPPPGQGLQEARSWAHGPSHGILDLTGMQLSFGESGRLKRGKVEAMAAVDSGRPSLPHDRLASVRAGFWGEKIVG